MKHLSKDWLTENHIDLEYKRYLLLAYLEDVKKEFSKKLLYPGISELIGHYAQLKSTQEELQALYKAFPEDITSINLAEIKLEKQKRMQQDSIVEELERIIDFSIPCIESSLAFGKSIYDEVESFLKLEPIGILPIYKDCGYIFIEKNQPSELLVYSYELTLFDHSLSPYRSLSTEYIKSVKRGFASTPESLKLELIRNHKKLPNPATYFISSTMDVDFDQTYFPIAKRRLMRELSQT